jgi:hypothetical protein
MNFYKSILKNLTGQLKKVEGHEQIPYRNKITLTYKKMFSSIHTKENAY